MLRDAEKFYKQSLEIHEKLELDRSIADSLHRLIVVHLDSKQVDLAKNDMMKFKKLSRRTKSKIVKQSYRLSEASFRVDIGKEMEMDKALELLEQLMTENFTDYEIEVEVLLNLCKLLFLKAGKQSETVQKEEMYRKLDFYVRSLFKIADRHSTSLKIESLILQSNLDLLKTETDTSGVAQQHLKKAQLLAEDKGLFKKSEWIANELESMSKKSNKYVEGIEGC